MDTGENRRIEGSTGLGHGQTEVAGSIGRDAHVDRSAGRRVERRLVDERHSRGGIDRHALYVGIRIRAGRTGRRAALLHIPEKAHQPLAQPSRANPRIVSTAGVVTARICAYAVTHHVREGRMGDGDG